jgi:holo-[acyl-carrier protein] synthase
MIIGIGSDLVDIRRVEKVLARYGDKFEQRVFTPIERAKAQSRSGGIRNGKASTLAKRFAAKEAMAKALGTGFSQGVFHKDMGVINLPSGAPTVELCNGALQALERLLNGKKARIHLTLTDEYPIAQALVIIEKID